MRGGMTEARAHLRRTVRTWLDDPEAVELIRRSLEAGVVLDTWMAGRRPDARRPGSAVSFSVQSGIHPTPASSTRATPRP